MNDFSPVALTLALPNVTKDLCVTSRQQLLPIAWTHCNLHIGRGRGVEDAALTTPLSSKDQSYFSSIKKKPVIILQGANLLWTRRNVSTVSKIVGSKQLQLSQLYQVSVKRNIRQIVSNTTHPLNVCFQRLPSGSLVPLARRNFYEYSLIPA